MMSVKKGDQIQMNDCDQHNEGNITYSLRKSKLLEDEKMNKLEDAIHYIRIKRDQKGFIVKMVNKDIGKGVFATRDFATGSFLLEYDGELINVAEGRQREKSYPLDLGSYIFFFQHKSKKFCIDATFSKRKGRFVNDGIEKEQNSVMKLIDVDNIPHLALFALKNISKGEEIRYDYGVPNLPWRTKRINKKKCADKEDIQTSDSGVSKKSSERENETVETVKDCRIDLVRLSSETIQGFLTGCRTQGNYFQRTSGNESLVVERKSHIIESISEESLFARQEEQNLSSSQMESQIEECMFETSVLAQDEKMEEHNSNCKVDSIENHIPTANVLHENQEGQNFDSLMASQIEESISETTPLIMGEDQQNSSFLLESKRVESQFVQIEDEGGQTLNCMVDQPKNYTPKTNFLNESQEEHTLISQNAVVEDISEISHLAQDKDGEGQDYNCRLESQKVEKICKKNSLVDDKCQKPQIFKCTVESQEEEYILETNPLVLDDDQEGQKCRSEKANETILEEVEGPLLQLDDHVTRAQERKVICSEHEFDDTMQIIGEDNIGNLMEEKEFETGEGKMQIFDKETQASVNYFSETDRLTEDEGQETHTGEADHGDKDGEMIDDNVTENSHVDFCENELTTTSKESTETLEKEFFSCVEKLLNSEFVKERLTRDSTGKPNFLVETLGKLKVHLASPSKTSAHIAKAQPSLHEAQIDDTEGIENNQENVEIVLEEDKESQDKVGHAIVDGENKNKKTSKKGTSKPKRPCPFCGKFVGDLTKHLKSRIHKDEEEVKAALAMKKQERNHAFSLLRRKGYNKVNIERIREHGDDAEMITERKRGLDKEHAICSLCNGMFVKAFMSRHKRRCKVAESTTSAPVSIPVNAIVEDKLTQDFKEKVLTKFLNNEVGNLCRTDTFIRQFGNHRYKRAVARIDKRIEIRVNTMSEMRRLAGLYLCYKKEAEKEKIETTSAADLFRRKHFDLLEDALSEFTTDGDGKLKSGLRRGLGYLLKKAAMYLKGHALQQNNEDEFNEMGKFLVLFQHNYPSLFDAAEYNCLKARQKKLRRPARLPEESDVTTLRDYNLAEIRRLVSDEYKLLNNHEYIRLRDCVVCRLTLFNARRGGEPSRLDLSEWEDAKKNVWLTKDCESVTDDPLEKMLLGRFKLAYQSGKNIKDMVPNLIPEDCWLALLKLADPGIRQAANITQTNEYLFPSEQSELHVSGWYCCDRACKKAGISKTITATDMRHRASTLYAGLDVSDSDRQIFYKHMGHSAEINRDVYQCPISTKEITKVGRFLARIDGQSLDDIMKASEVKCNGENVRSEPSGSQESINDPLPSTSGQSRSTAIDEVNSLLSQYNIQAFLEPLVDEHVMLRAVSGRGLIDEDEVETIPGNLKVAKHLLCDPAMQKKVRQYFTDDGWTTAISTIRIMEEYDAVEKRQPTKSKRKRKVEEDSDDSFELNESDCSSDEDVYKVKSAERKGKKLVQKSSMAKQKERQYYQWKEQESEIVKEYFKENINDISSLDSKGSIPGKKAIKQFLDKHPILNELKFEERIRKVKTKILNERKTIRQKVKKTLDKYVQ